MNEPIKRMPALQTDWRQVSVTDLSLLLMKVVVAAVPAVALAFLIYIALILSTVTMSGLLR